MVLEAAFTLFIRNPPRSFRTQMPAEPDHGLRQTPHPRRNLAVHSLKYKLSPDPDRNPGLNPGHRLHSGSDSRLRPESQGQNLFPNSVLVLSTDSPLLSVTD